MVANLSYVVCVASALAYAALVLWGYLEREPGGSLLALFAIWQLLPFAIAARIAYVHRNYPIRSLVILAGIIAAEALALFLLPRIAEAVHHEQLAVSQGAKNCGPPAVLIAMFGLGALPVAQLLVLGLCGIFAMIVKAFSPTDTPPQRLVELDGEVTGGQPMKNACGFTSELVQSAGRFPPPRTDIRE